VPASPSTLTSSGVDPVCGMDAGATSPYRIEHEGRVHYFCCASCHDRFAGSPQAFLSTVARKTGAPIRTPDPLVEACWPSRWQRRASQRTPRSARALLQGELRAEGADPPVTDCTTVLVGACS
jgi:YHS domain-containing protein